MKERISQQKNKNLFNEIDINLLDSSKHDFNQLTFQIGQFRKDEKKIKIFYEENLKKYSKYRV